MKQSARKMVLGIVTLCVLSLAAPSRATDLDMNIASVTNAVARSLLGVIGLGGRRR